MKIDFSKKVKNVIKTTLIMIRKLFVFTFILMNINNLLAQSVFPQSSLWIRTKNINDSTNVWKDVGKDSLDVQLPDYFSYKNESINFNQCISVDTLDNAINIDYDFDKNSEITVFCVYQPDTVIQNYGIWETQLDSLAKLELSTCKVRDLKNEFWYNDSVSFSNPKINLFRSKWANQSIDTVFSKVRILGNDSLPFRGNFAELLFFDTPMDYVDITKVYTYLSIKYGISLKGMNYLNSKDEILWEYNEDSDFIYDIAGIGKDTALYINQKQSSADGGQDILTISAGDLHAFNDSNNYEINNYDFLIWSDNGQSFDFDSNDSVDIDTCISNKKWLMTRNGVTAMNINTNIKVFYPEFSDSTFIFLVVDRNADINTPFDEQVVYYPDSVSVDGYVYFNDIHWDVDSSGQDLFTFKRIKFNQLLCSNQSENNSENENNDQEHENIYQENGESGDTGNDLNNNEEDSFYPNNGNDNDNDNGNDNGNDNDNGINNNNKFYAYPNPNEGDFKVYIELHEDANVEYTILDEASKVIKNTLLTGHSMYDFYEHIETKGYYYLLFSVSGKKENVIKIIVK